jgi:hypothetical protein
MIKSYGCKDWQWAEAAANAGEVNGGKLITITRHGDLSGLRIWIRWPGNIPDPDPVGMALRGHR